MHVMHPNAGEGDGVPPAQVDVNGTNVAVADDGTFEVPDDRTGWLKRFASRYDAEPANLGVEDAEQPDDSDGLSFDPSEHTVDEVEEHVESIDGSDVVAELEAIRGAEVESEDRKGAKEAIDGRLDELED